MNHNVFAAVDQVYETQPAVVGREYIYLHETYGEQVYVLVFNDSGADLAAYSVLAFDSGSSLNADLAPAACVKYKLAGINQVEIPDQYFGFVLKRGDGLATSDAAVAANARLRVVAASGTNGRVDDAAVATDVDEYFALSVGTASGAAENFRVRVQLP